MYYIVKYKDTRYWAVLHHNGKLLAVVVYKKAPRPLSRLWSKSSSTPSPTCKHHAHD